MDSFYARLNYEFIRFSGADALSFLQNMTTNDLSALADPGNTRLTGFCSREGRLLGLMQLSGEGKTLYARVPEGMADLLIERLKPFVFRLKVEMTPVGERWCVVGVAGLDIAEYLTRADVPVPEGPGQTAGREGLHVMCIRDHVMEIAVPLTGLTELTNALDAVTIRAGEAADWERLAIADGIPEIYPTTMDQFIPQMVNLDKIGGLSFDKGCYPGQEIIARIRSRGSVKRHMHRAEADADPAPGPGTDILDRAGKSIGHVARSTTNEHGATMLAVIADGAMGSDLLLTDNIPLTIQRSKMSGSVEQ